MPVDSKLVKALRDKTNAGVMNCREALEKNNCDLVRAEEWIREKGMADADKKADRATKQGLVGTYIHLNGKGGAMVELCCESDFVARGDDFQALLRDICQQVYAMSPRWVARTDVPAKVVEDLKSLWANELEGKPPEIAEKILAGKLEKKLYSQDVLLDQMFVKDQEHPRTVGELIKSKIAVIKENIVVRRFARFEIGAQ